LKGKFYSEDEQEVEVVKESSEDVEIFKGDIPAIDLVEQLHQHKCVKQQSVMQQLVVGGNSSSVKVFIDVVVSNVKHEGCEVK
jgi:hypothetical protein